MPRMLYERDAHSSGQGCYMKGMPIPVVFAIFFYSEETCLQQAKWGHI